MKAKKRKKKAEPSSIHSLLSKVNKCIDVFSYESAIKWIEKGLGLYPNNTDLLEKGGVVSLELGLADEAYTYFSRAVAVSPDSGYSKYLYLGQLCGGTEAVGYILKGIQLLTKEPSGGDKSFEISSAYCNLAEIYLTDECFNEKADEDCLKYCLKAMSSCPSNPEAYQTTANYLLSKNETEEARSTLLKGIGLWLESVEDETSHENKDPKDVLSNNKKRDADNVSTQQQQQQSTGTFPSYDSRVNCAKLLLEVKEYKVAERVLTQLTREDDEIMSVWYLLGWCHYLTGNWTDAKSSLNRVTEC